MGCPGPSSTLFIGCQAIYFALANFLIHAPILSTSSLNSEDPHQRTGKSTSNVLEDTLLTKFVLGQYVGHQWELEKIMRWRELAPPSSSPCTSKIDASQPQSFHGTGLWTARGHVVEAIVGAVMAEHKHDHELENPKSGIIVSYDGLKPLRRHSSNIRTQYIDHAFICIIMHSNESTSFIFDSSKLFSKA
ncbi:hypothetical protein PSTG_15399 [Puccinia striiformis f. sp. tritici PST-78]|uniref:Uncharacterized protein n=1 Tax=Puccinia striiformis f. sp. tritici PST-78 TaxID=1165861 RepID=A0A0L0UWN2_9BASI|nr:hypothetical protein PSTG_15399 [Puccinia striiformis f. sp. tritici PST-78]